MEEQQNHLVQVVQQQKDIISEISELQSALDTKRNLGMKLQGIIEYLNSLGVTLPEAASEAAADEEETVEGAETTT
jgi:transposase